MEIALRRPDWVRRINAMGDAVGGARQLVSLDADEIVAAAVRSVGLDDFGTLTWREPFERLVAALDEEAELTTLGRLMTRQELVRGLTTRLLLHRAVRDDPSI